MTPQLTLALAGDVMLGRMVNRMIGDVGFTYPWGDVLPAIRSADCFLINLECALTDHSERRCDGGYKPFYFRANPGVVETLRVARPPPPALQALLDWLHQGHPLLLYDPS
jgi:ABC-type uncharacterized transport system YnjBCD substrate-binding protein